MQKTSMLDLETSMLDLAHWITVLEKESHAVISRQSKEIIKLRNGNNRLVKENKRLNDLLAKVGKEVIKDSPEVQLTPREEDYLFRKYSKKAN